MTLYVIGPSYPHYFLSESTTSKNSKKIFDNVDSYETTINHLAEMVNVVIKDLNDCSQIFDKSKSNFEQPLYEGYKKFTRLSLILKLYLLKASNGWSDKIFMESLELLKEILLNDKLTMLF